jgi:ATP-dependent helicase/nuclease subunit A
MQGFLAWLDQGGTEVKRDLEQGRDEVRVMTVHGAKGLEAPIVFLPDTCRVPDGHHDPAILWQGGTETPLPFWPASSANDTLICAEWRETDRERQRNEYRRLLYVAMTRAEDRLYIAGYHGRRPPAKDSWYELVWAALDGAASEVPLIFANEPETAGLRLHAPQTVPPRAEAAGASAISPPLPAWIARPAPPEPPSRRPIAPSRPESAELQAENPFRGDRGRRFRRGRLVHRLLQLLPDLDPARRDGAARRFLARAAADMAENERDLIAAQVFAVLGHPETAPLFAPGSRAEAPLAAFLDGRPLFGQIDRLAVREEEVLIADYKSDRDSPPAPAAVPTLYVKQMAAYRAALGAIYPGRAIRCFLVWTTGPKVMPLPDALLDGASGTA